MRRFIPLTVCLFINLSVIGQRNCPFSEYQQQSIRANPELFNRIQEIESFTRSRLQTRKFPVAGQDQQVVPPGRQAAAPSVIMIPVVVHIVYNTAAQNITDAQVLSQIAVLNRDYGKHNADTSAIPGYYSALAADCGFQFALAKVDTNGNTSTGIVRKHTNVQSFDVNDNIKFSADGGDDAWDRDRYLNIWVGNLTEGTVGYSSIVGGARAVDGVTILYTAFGTMGTATAPFNLGRTATHEIGHWLNLIHVWGDANCGNDEVEDTPPQQQATYGDPSGEVVSCNNAPYGDMYMNYMDFTDDIGMHMFTYGQRARMNTLFVEGGFRYPLLSSSALVGISSANSTADTISGSSEGIAKGINVYPNPAAGTGTVFVTLSGLSAIGSLLIVYNQIGQEVMTTRITSAYLRLDVSSLSKGVYFIRVNDSNPHDITRLIRL